MMVQLWKMSCYLLNKWHEYWGCQLIQSAAMYVKKS